MKHLRYFKYVMKHKWFVFQAGLKTGAPIWRLIIHDYTKFSRAEWTPYANRFFGGRSGIEDKELDPNEFKLAWEHHWKHNPHHWEYWISNWERWIVLPGPGLAQDMPDNFINEMIADWMGAGRAITGQKDIMPWFEKTYPKMNLSFNTKLRLIHRMKMIGIML